MTIRALPEGTAGFVEAIVKEAFQASGPFASIKLDPCKIELIIREDPAVPGGWAISAKGMPYPAVGQPGMGELEDRLIDWLTSGDTGTSSKVIFHVLSGRRGDTKGWYSWPHDPSDFGRCFRLLVRFPEWRGRLGEVAKACRGWAPMIAAWDELEALWNEESGNKDGMAPKLYARMKVLGDLCTEAEKAADGKTKP